MCKSLEVSLITGLFSYALSYYFWIRNGRFDRPLAIFIVVFSTIQWLEAAIWGSFRYNMPWLNTLATFLIPIVLASEFMASGFIGYQYNSISQQSLYLFGLVGIAFLYIWYNSCGNLMTSVDAQTGSLLWCDNTGLSNSQIGKWIFLALLLGPFVPIIGEPSVALIVYGTLITFLIATAYGQTFSSNWCWLSNFIILLQLFIGRTK